MGHRTAPTIALFCGALAIGFAPVFAAFALKPEYGGFGPAAIGFYRVFFALPFLWLVLLAAPGKAEQPKRIRRPTGLLALAGFFFAIDLVSWHWSIKYTTVANATLLANFAPLWVMLWAGRLFGERITPRFLGALGLAIVGAAVLMNASFRLSPTQLFGDALSLHPPGVRDRHGGDAMKAIRCQGTSRVGDDGSPVMTHKMDGFISETVDPAD